jgi:UDP-N-acetylglucosamine 2-epimerase (non-hydrolysing)
MRRIVFVTGSRARLDEIAPILKKAAEAGLRYDIWLVDETAETAEALADELGFDATFSSAGKRAGRTGLLGARALHEHVSALKTWTGRPPLVVVYGESASTFLATLGARFGGGWIVHLESGISSRALFDPFPEEMLRRMTFRMTNFALCADMEANERMRGYHCKVEEMGGPLSGEDPSAAETAAVHDSVVDALVSWSR